MPRKGWKSVTIPEVMYSHIEHLLRKYPRLFLYANVSEYVREAVREKVSQDSKHLGVAADDKPENL